LEFGDSFSEEVRVVLSVSLSFVERAYAFFYSSTLTTYYYGNLSYPSQDPPKLGFLSTVPSDASGRMQSAASAAAKANNNFPGKSFFRDYM
jgi:hypothetical protein